MARASRSTPGGRTKGDLASLWYGRCAACEEERERVDALADQWSEYRTDDGKTWWTIAGYCEGPGMTSMHFDFSPKGGPADASAVWAKDAAGKVTMTFGDGNAWELLAETSDSAGVPPAASLVAAKPAAGSSANVNYALGLVLAVGVFGMGYFTAKKRRSNFDQIA